MPDPLLPQPAVQPSSVTVNGLTLTLAPTRETVSIGPFAKCLPDLDAALASTFGVTLPADFSTASGQDGLQLTRAAHHQWFAHAPAGASLMARLAPLCAGLAALTNQTDSRVTLYLRGTGADAVAAKLVPIDLAPDHFGPGSTALTLAGHIPVILSRPDGTPGLDFTVFRSFARSLHHDIHVAMKGGIPNSERV
ncbi:sarcosine oxidase subunit gamma [Acetobacter tropicalis]|uniref:sarcosine oxidase subunit gamma n=1 Tax=Acetobacter tropicalis TaxID=104102 RepID=UPI000A36E6DA|nr:hypothetical protein [Acetobacter tropicalis]